MSGDIMQQYFVKEQLKIGEIVHFDEEQNHHMVNVLRMKNDEKVFIVDNTSNKFLACLKIEDKTIYGIVEKKVENSVEIPNRIIIAQGLIKGDRWDYFIEKSVEFGVHDIIPLILRRNVVKVKDDINKKLERWNKIALSAAKQAKRDVIPTVHAPLTLEELVKLEIDYKLVAYEDLAGEKSLINTLDKIQDSQSIILVVGSEGGFEKNEVDYLITNGYSACGLGPRILRAEDAAIYFLSAVSIKREYLK